MVQICHILQFNTSSRSCTPATVLLALKDQLFSALISVCAVVVGWPCFFHKWSLLTGLQIKRFLARPVSVVLAKGIFGELLIANGLRILVVGN